MCCNRKIIINQIKAAKSFCKEIKTFHIFIGQEAYKGCSNGRQSNQLVLDKDCGYYEYTNGKVAFIPESEAYPSSFIFLVKMIFDDFDIIEDFFENTDSKSFTIFLYNKGYLFINFSDIDKSRINELMSIAKDIIICGHTEDNKSYIDLANQIEEMINQQGIKTIHLIHPSGVNIDRERFTKEWIKHDASSSDNHDFDLKELIVEI